MKSKAFTLIELLVVSSVIIILSVMILINWRAGGQEIALQRAANKLTQDIRRAGEMAMSAKKFQGAVPRGGYGIYLRQNNTYYLLYADTNPAAGNEKYNKGDGIVETIHFEKGVYIKTISLASLLSINFRPPNPTIRINTSDSVTAVITLSLENDPTKTRIIKVNTAGLIYAQ